MSDFLRQAPAGTIVRVLTSFGLVGCDRKGRLLEFLNLKLGGVKTSPDSPRSCPSAFGLLGRLVGASLISSRYGCSNLSIYYASRITTSFVDVFSKCRGTLFIMTKTRLQNLSVHYPVIYAEWKQKKFPSLVSNIDGKGQHLVGIIKNIQRMSTSGHKLLP